MQDYFYTPKDGSRTPVSELPTSLILQLLQEGIEITDPFSSPCEDVKSVRRRLELELEIRNLGLR